MMKLPKTTGSASGVACLAIVALAVGNAFAQFQQEERRQGSDQQNQGATQYSFQSDEESIQSNQSRQQNQQSQQGGQQAWQRDQQSQQRDQQAWQRDQQSQRSQQQYGRDEQFGSESQQSGRWPQPGESGQRGQQGQQAELGVNIQSQGEQGVTVIRVRPGSAAEQIGLQRDDRITQLNGQQVQSERQFIQQIRNMQPGEQVELIIYRDDEEQTVSGQLQPRQSIAQSGQLRQRDEVYQSGYEEGERSSRSSRGDSSARIEQLERQIDRLSQQIDDIRSSIREMRQSNRETTARYDEFGGQSQRRQSERWSGDTNRYGQAGNRRQFQTQQSQQGQRSRELGQQGQQGQRGQQSQRSGQQRDQSQQSDQIPPEGQR